MSGTYQPPACRRIEGFRVVSGAPGLEYCISGAQPYTLDMHNPSEMICLLLGTIVAETRYDDGPAVPFTFEAETAAFHPRGGSMRIDAQQVSHGFIAFRYRDPFQSRITDSNARATRRVSSRSNLGANAIRHLVRYARLKVPVESSLQVAPVGDPVSGDARLDRDHTASGKHCRKAQAGNFRCRIFATRTVCGEQHRGRPKLRGSRGSA
jgi:AraC family transcriptional regulator